MTEKVIYLRRSNQYIFIVIFFHLLAVAALVVTPIYPIARYMGLITLFISILVCLYIYYKSYLHNVTLGDTFSDLIVENSQGEKLVQLLASSVVTEFYICLHCKKITGRKKYYYVLLKDSFNSKDDLRIFASWIRQAFI
ncbi:MAG: hypothetical protein ACJA0H_000608 [Francisellaceae bacterium]|jgi:hypothetical protein